MSWNIAPDNLNAADTTLLTRSAVKTAGASFANMVNSLRPSDAYMRQ